MSGWSTYGIWGIVIPIAVVFGSLAVVLLHLVLIASRVVCERKSITDCLHPFIYEGAKFC